jgi:hypothetical protein
MMRSVVRTNAGTKIDSPINPLHPMKAITGALAQERRNVACRCVPAIRRRTFGSDSPGISRMTFGPNPSRPIMGPIDSAATIAKNVAASRVSSVRTIMTVSRNAEAIPTAAATIRQPKLRRSSTCALTLVVTVGPFGTSRAWAHSSHVLHRSFSSSARSIESGASSSRQIVFASVDTATP